MAIIIWKSKLSKDAYPMADHTIWVTGDKDNIDPVVLGRAAAVGKAFNSPIRINSGGGYRSKADQDEMWALYKAGKLKATAAVPYTSWHGSGLAFDTSSYPIREDLSAANLAKYGLCKPLSNEPWHVQPIETAKMGAKCNMTLAPVDIGAEFQQRFGLSDSTMKFIASFRYASELVEKRLAGVLDMSKLAIDYLDDYPYWPQLKEKTGIY